MPSKKTKDFVVVSDIQWDFDVSDVLESFDELSVDEASKYLEIPSDRYANMHDSERHDYILDVFKEDWFADSLSELFHLPQEVSIPSSEFEPDDLKDIRNNGYAEAVSDWLSDEYSFCVKGFSAAIDKQAVKESDSLNR